MDDGMMPTAGQVIGCACVIFFLGVGTGLFVLWLAGGL